jgi:hypothetical protein
MQRGLFDFPTAISLQDDIFGEQIRQSGHFSALYSGQKAGKQLPVHFRSAFEAWAPLDQVLLCPAEGAATGGFTLQNGGEIRFERVNGRRLRTLIAQVGLLHEILRIHLTAEHTVGDGKTALTSL